MEKRYARLADRLGADESDEPGVDVVRKAPGDSLSWSGTKTFQIARRFEYRRVDRGGHGQLLTEDELNTLGAEGWELAGVVADHSGTHYYLKRGRGAAATG
jgi:hypothetical protein